MQSEIHNLQHIGPLVLSFRYFGLISSPRLCLDSGEILEGKEKRKLQNFLAKERVWMTRESFVTAKKKTPARNTFPQMSSCRFNGIFFHGKVFSLSFPANQTGLRVWVNPKP